MQKKIVMFDFDGVITQTFKMCLEIEKMIEPNITADEYRGRFNDNINVSRLDEPKCNIDFFGEYTNRILNVPIIPGIAETIIKLSADYLLLIVSSTNLRPIDLFLQQNQLQQYFDEILGNEVDHSKAQKFRIVLEKYNVTNKDCLMITDTSGDIHEANEVNIPTIAVTWGYHPLQVLIQENPQAIVSEPREIPSKVNEVFGV